MKKLFILPFLLFLLSGCTTAGVDNSLYKDGKEIIQMTVSNVKSGQMEYTKGQQMKFDNFQSKYSSKFKNSKDNNFQYYQDVFWVGMNYSLYSTNQELKYLDGYNSSLKDLKNKFNMKVD